MQSGASGDDGTSGTGRGGPQADGGQPDQTARRPPRQGTLGDRLRDVADDLPLAAGGFIGAVSLLIPYVLVTAATMVAANRGDPVEVAAGMFFTVVQFGSGQDVIREFIAVTDVSTLANVHPPDYPSVQSELAAAQDMLLRSPEAGLLLLYVAFPWICYLGGRYLSGRYALGDTFVDYLRAGITVVAGTLPVVLLLGIYFKPPNLAGLVLLVGVLVPALAAGLGALSVWVFRDVAAATSKAAGWTAVAVGVLVTFPLLPSLPDSIEAPQQLLLAIGGYLASITFDFGFEARPTLIFLAVVLVTVLAGFGRAYVSRDALVSRTEGARIGGSIVLGVVGAVALVAAAVPLLTIVISFPLGSSGGFASALHDFGDYLRFVVVGGTFGLVLGALGGYLAAWYTEPPANGASPPAR